MDEEKKPPQFDFQKEREAEIKKIEDLKNKYRFVLLSQMGIDIFRDFLARACHFGKTLDPDNKAQIAEYNNGIWLIAQCGDFNEVMRALSSPIKQGGEK